MSRGTEPLPGLQAAVAKDRPSIADALGGRQGLLDSGLPGVVFVLTFTVGRQLTWSLWAAVATSAVLTAVRLVRRQTLQHAFSGFLGILLCAFIARRSGKAEDFYLPGLWINAGYAAGYLVSILIRWPLLGVLLGFLTGEGTSWRRDPARLRAYCLASWVWVGMFVLRIAVQYPLYAAGNVTALGVARVAMNLPLLAVAVYASWRILRAVPPARAESEARP